MRRRSNLTPGGSRDQSSSVPEDEVDENTLRSYLYDVVKLPKNEGLPVEYRVEGVLSEPSESEENLVAKTLIHRQNIVVDESEWGNTHQIKHQSQGLWRWITVVISIIVVSLVIMHVTRKPEIEEKPSGYFLEKTHDEAIYNQAVAPLIADTRIHIKAVDLVEKLLRAKKWEEVADLCRPSSSLREHLRQHWKPISSPPMLQNDDDLIFDYGHSGNVGFYLIEGRCVDNTPFTYYFVNVEGKLKIDWMASMNVGDLTLEEIIQRPLKEPAMMRIVFERSPFYLPSLKEEEYESFRLTQPGNENVIWGYVKRGSPQAAALNTILLQGGVLMETQEKGRAAVILVPTEEKASKRFFIDTVISQNWVIP